MRFEIRYVTTLVYPGAVRESQNVLRACPTNDARQRLVRYRVATTPTSRVHAYGDYFGTRVDAFGVRAAHERLEILAEAVVETRPTGPMVSCPRFFRLKAMPFAEDHLEYLEPSPHARWNETLRAQAERIAAPAGDDVVGAVVALHRFVGTSLVYTAGATSIGVDVNEVLRGRRGVSQDFAHLLIAMCRSLGVPARYVSGYLFAADDGSGAAPDLDVTTVKTHAWVEAAIPGAGWWGLDPTHQREVGPRHVKIGHGRDYDDVPPMRGVYLGPSPPTLEVAVRMRSEVGAQQQ